MTTHKRCKSCESDGDCHLQNTDALNLCLLIKGTLPKNDDLEEIRTPKPGAHQKAFDWGEAAAGGGDG